MKQSMSRSSRYTLKDRLEQIAESIDLVIDRCENVHTANEFLLSPDNVMKFDSCVMRLQAIIEMKVQIHKELAPSFLLGQTSRFFEWLICCNNLRKQCNL